MGTTYKRTINQNELGFANVVSDDILRNTHHQEILLPDSVLSGGFRLAAFLGAGGMSQVWRAEAPDGGVVAIKLPRSDVTRDFGAQELIRREFEILNSLNHPCVSVAIDLVTLGGSSALVTEYLGEGDLVSLCGAHPRCWAGAARDLAGALEYIHNQGMVHLDVKPRNVLFDSNQRAHLIDFALAEPLSCQTLKGGGTPAYQGPGQRRGEAPAVADDVYAFATLLYELITGCLPFGVNPSLACPEPLALPLGPSDSSLAFSELAELVHATLGPDPGCRPKSMYVFLDVLESVIAFWR